MNMTRKGGYEIFDFQKIRQFPGFMNGWNRTTESQSV